MSITNRPMLEIKNLHVSVGEKPVLEGVNLVIKTGEIHAVMGPNGAGKSTLSGTLMGHPAYRITKGDIRLNGKSLIGREPHERALAGLFLAFQYPKEISGITLEEFLLAAYRAKQKHLHPGEPPILPFRFKKMLHERMRELKMDTAFADRYLNHGFSGGEKKKSETLQMAILEPDMAILDETDSGLDVDALKTVADRIRRLHKKHPMGVLLVTHYQHLLSHLKPDFVHVMKRGEIILSGDRKLAAKLEKTGYESL